MADVPHYNAVYIGHAHTHSQMPSALHYTLAHTLAHTHVPPHTKLKRMSPDAALIARVTQAVVFFFFYSYMRAALPQY